MTLVGSSELLPGTSLDRLVEAVGVYLRIYFSQAHLSVLFSRMMPPFVNTGIELTQVTGLKLTRSYKVFQQFPTVEEAQKAVCTLG